MLNTPILLITFNRPSHTQKVLESILNAQPKDLYVFQDGAREGNENDNVKCAQVREVVDSMTKDSPVHLHTNYSSKNWGCGAGPMTGITWFFNQVERGIVMEDDCLPHPDFYGYCEELLERYNSNEQVHFINATLYRNRWKCEYSYDFSRYMVTGAWAGWRRTWQGFDLDLKTLDAKKFRKHVLKLTGNIVEARWWYSLLRDINIPVYPILPLTHPTTIKVDKKRDAYCWTKNKSNGWLRDRISYIYSDLRWSDGIGHKMLMRYKKNKGTGINTKRV